MEEISPVLPEDFFINEILLRLNVKTIGRSQCVSKQWCSLLSSPEFVKSHFKLHFHDPPENIIFTGPSGESVYTADLANGGASRKVIPSVIPADRFKWHNMAVEGSCRKDYYKRVGKAWKRGHLLYGPPGTGKSSLIAAMADYLKYDIYDLDLKAVKRNTELRKLLLRSSNKSILVVEDIDCCGVKVNKRKDVDSDDDDDDDSDSDDDYDDGKITLSGLLNFIDGLWSSCGEERVIVFTTNHKEELAPALLRPGRMDVHIEMSYCKFGSFKTLARNYLRVEDHQLFGEIESLLSEVNVSPAEVAGQLMKSNDSDVALQILVKYLTSKIKKKTPKDTAKPGTDQEDKKIQEDKIIRWKPPYHRNKQMRRRRNRY